MLLMLAEQLCMLEVEGQEGHLQGNDKLTNIARSLLDLMFFYYFEIKSVLVFIIISDQLSASTTIQLAPPF